MPRGPGCCHCTPTPCALCIQADGCNGSPLAGATVTIKLAGSTVASGATAMQVVCQVTVQGTGYTSAPSVAFSGGGGSGAAATAYVSSGKVVEVVMTSQGTGYTSAPTVTLSGGGGSGAAATATLDAFFCAQLAAGNYTYDLDAGSGFRTLTDQSAPLACPSLQVYGATPGLATGHVCPACSSCALPTTLTLTDPEYGAVTLSYSTTSWLGVPGWVGSLTVNFAGCDTCPAAANVGVRYGLYCSGGQFYLHVGWAENSPTQNCLGCPTANTPGGDCGPSNSIATLASCSPLLITAPAVGGELYNCGSGGGYSITS